SEIKLPPSETASEPIEDLLWEQVSDPQGRAWNRAKPSWKEDSQRTRESPFSLRLDLVGSGAQASTEASSLGWEAKDGSAGLRYLLQPYREGEAMASTIGGPWVVEGRKGKTFTLRHEQTDEVRVLDLVRALGKEGKIFQRGDR